MAELKSIIGVLEENKMSPQIYILASESEKFTRDIYYTHRIAELNRESPVDVVFMDSGDYYPSVENYCFSNETSAIAVKKSNCESPTDYFLRIFSYLQEHRNIRRAVTLERISEGEKLEDLFKKTNFDVESVVV